LGIGHWKKPQWLQEPNVNEARRERKVTREIAVVSVAEIRSERLVMERKEILADTTSGILGSDLLPRRPVH